MLRFIQMMVALTLSALFLVALFIAAELDWRPKEVIR